PFAPVTFARRMRVKFEAVFKVYVICLVALLVWCMWANAQDSTNQVSKPSEASDRTNALRAYFSTNAPLDFGLRKVEVLQPNLMGVPRWQYVASLIYILLAFVVARLLDWLIRNKLRQLAAKTKTQLDDILIQLLGGPIKVIAFVILLHVGLQLFPWPDAAE